MKARTALLELFKDSSGWRAFFRSCCEISAFRLRSQAWQYRDELADRGHKVQADEVEDSLLELASLRCEMGERTAAGICSPVRFGVQLLQTHRAANVRVMVSRLAVSTPHPTHLPKPSSPLSRHLPRYSRRFMTLMRPSIPALNLLALL